MLFNKANLGDWQADKQTAQSSQLRTQDSGLGTVTNADFHPDIELSSCQFSLAVAAMCDVLCVAVPSGFSYSEYLAESVGIAVQKFNFQPKRYNWQPALRRWACGWEQEWGWRWGLGVTNWK